MLRTRAKGFQCLCPQARHRSLWNSTHTRPFTGRPQSILEPTANTLVPLDPSEPRQKSGLQIQVYLGNKHLQGWGTTVLSDWLRPRRQFPGLGLFFPAGSSALSGLCRKSVLHPVSQSLPLQGPALAPPPEVSPPCCSSALRIPDTECGMSCKALLSASASSPATPHLEFKKWPSVGPWPPTSVPPSFSGLCTSSPPFSGSPLLSRQG